MYIWSTCLDLSKLTTQHFSLKLCDLGIIWLIHSWLGLMEGKSSEVDKAIKYKVNITISDFCSQQLCHTNTIDSPVDSDIQSPPMAGSCCSLGCSKASQGESRRVGWTTCISGIGEGGIKTEKPKEDWWDSGYSSYHCPFF